MKNKIWKHSLIYLGLLLSFTLFNSTVLSKTFSVNSFKDIDDEIPGDGDCSIPDIADCTLRAAVSEANALEGPDTILLQGGTYLITGAMGDDINQEGDLDISDDLTIQGEGARKTILSRQGDGRVVHIINSKVSLLDLTIQDGYLPDAVGNGSGILNEMGDLTVYQSTIKNNQTEGIGPDTDGGGIYSENGNLTIEYSTIKGNKVSNGHGGGIHIFQSLLFIHASTISGNYAGGDGGGVSAGPLLGSFIHNSTIVFNKSNGQGGGVYMGSPIALEGNLIALNQYKDDMLDPQSDCVFHLILEGHNLIGVDCFLENFEVTDIIGETHAPIDPMIGPLQDNGGPTDTHALLAGSRAIGNGNPDDCPEFDQRGFARAEGEGCDIGAFQTICGDEVKSGNEECDDGNKVDGDGCDALCKLELDPAPPVSSSGGCSLTVSKQTNSYLLLLVVFLWVFKKSAFILKK